MIYYRTYKYLIKPNLNQTEQIRKTFDCCTYVYNKYLTDKENGLNMNRSAKEILADYKKQNGFLQQVDVSALMNVLFKLQDNRLNRLMIKTKNRKLKSYTTSNLSGRQAIYFVGEELINIPMLGLVKIVKHRPIPDNVKIVNTTIKLDNIDNYYACISISFENKATNSVIDLEKCIGLDYSSPHLFIDDNGNEVNTKHFYQDIEPQINKLKEVLCKTKKNSKQYFRIKTKIGKLYKKSVNQRMDYLHKLSTNIANNYDIVCVEDLDMNEIASGYNLAKNTYDNSYGMFLKFLKYKLEDRGKLLMKVDRYFPSSKKCNVCGHINSSLKLSDREWICPNCHTKHNRDINAAINIRNRGLEEFISIGYLD